MDNSAFDAANHTLAVRGLPTMSRASHRASRARPGPGKTATTTYTFGMYTQRHQARRGGRFSSRIICPALLCLALHSAHAESLALQVVDASGAPAPGIAVYLEAVDRDLPAGSHQVAIEILQQNKGFVPYVSVVQAGSTVTFSNLDDITHHIYSVTGRERFSVTLKTGEITDGMTIEQAGLIAMGCNIHDWMSGYLLVVDTPYYATTDARGRALIEVELGGRYRVVTWHPQIEQGVQQEVILPGAGSVTLALAQAMPKLPRQQGVDDFDFLEGY